MIHKRFSLLIGPNDVFHYDVMLFPAFCWTKHHFRSSDKLVVDMSNSDSTETTTISRSQRQEYRIITTNPFTTNSKTSSRDFIFINLIVLCYLTRTTANWIRWYKISNMHEILKENRLTNFTTCKNKLEPPQSNMQRNNIWMYNYELNASYVNKA